MTEPTLDPKHLSRWIGNTESARDSVDAWPVRAMHALLDRDGGEVAENPLPPLWHWLFFRTLAKRGELGADGHPRLGSFLPPVDLPRRMWAGGRFRFLGPIAIGSELAKISTVKDVALKHGRSGPLCFVTVEHRFQTGGETLLSEEHDIVYRAAAKPGAGSGTGQQATLEEAADHEVEEQVRPDPVMLFRYSALTYNGHRIHYDRRYCAEVEGYPGLVFHGPLTATLLADLAARMKPGKVMTRFSFRAVSPLFDTAPFAIRGRSGEQGLEGDTVETWALTPQGGLAMRAEAVFG